MAAGFAAPRRKALDLLDQACARARIPTDQQAHGQTVGVLVTPRTVAEVLGEWKGISVDALLDAECWHIRAMQIHEYQHWLEAWDKARGWDRVPPSHTLIHALEELGEVARLVSMGRL